MRRPDLALLADALVSPTLAAGRAEMRHYELGVAVEHKSDASPVTAADREAEAILTAAISLAAPGVPIIAEEAVSAGHVPDFGTLFFLVDPLDGTKEFINRRDEFTVNIALVEHGEPVFGIVYAPALQRLYVTQGAGVLMAAIAPEASATRLSECQGTLVRCRKADPARLTAMASRSHGSDATEAFLEGYAIAERRNAGSSLKFCAIAAGTADVYPRLAPTCEWDTAAGHAVLAAAGGQVVKLDGTPLRYGNAAGRFLNPSFIAWGGPPVRPRSG